MYAIEVKRLKGSSSREVKQQKSRAMKNATLKFKSTTTNTPIVTTSTMFSSKLLFFDVTDDKDLGNCLSPLACIAPHGKYSDLGFINRTYKGTCLFNAARS